ncbi:DUF1707 SHOCT-like domain-containing protein [Brevibacterium album]|uniref:DUF1707 SHOCT-like domain-containing protein n=1 Tax=Brevibacterium album TaxID=417948 RepID=UPI000407CD89|nr:DUF1707 domain-containing protein [Brevibacterium album]
MPLDEGIWAEFSADPHRQPELRASDSDRAVLFDAVGEAYAQGLLDADEHDERLTAAGAIKRLGDAVPLLEDIAPPPSHGAPGTELDARTAQALARLRESGDPVPTTPEAIDEAARAYYSARVKREAWGLLAGPIGICLAIWTFTAIGSGGFYFFWPLFVIIGVGSGFVSTLARRQSIIEERKRLLTLRARAHLGDPEAQRELEEGGKPEPDE